MDVEEANKFINSLVKNLQVLCHGHVNFNNSIQVIGHLYLNVDSQTNIDYIVNEKVCKNDNSSTMFVSNSYHSEPKIKKKAKESTSNNNSSESKDQRHQETQEPKKHQKQPQRAAERDTDFQSSISGHRSPHPSPQLHHQVYKRPSQDILSPALRQENSEKKRRRVSETSNESPMLNLSNIKSEPHDVDKEDESDWSFYDHQSSQGSIEELNNEFMSGIRDKKLAVYPVSVHPNDNTIQFNIPQLSTPSSSLHSTSDGDPGGTPFQVQPESLNVSESSLERYFPCIFCGKIFRHQPSLSRHVSAKHRAYRSTCPKCGQIFSHTKAMADHHTTCNGPGSNDDDVALTKSYPYTPVQYL